MELQAGCGGHLHAPPCALLAAFSAASVPAPCRACSCLGLCGLSELMACPLLSLLRLLCQCVRTWPASASPVKAVTLGRSSFLSFPCCRQELLFTAIPFPGADLPALSVVSLAKETWPAPWKCLNSPCWVLATRPQSHISPTFLRELCSGTCRLAGKPLAALTQTDLNRSTYCCCSITLGLLRRGD